MIVYDSAVSEASPWGFETRPNLLPKGRKQAMTQFAGFGFPKPAELP